MKWETGREESGAGEKKGPSEVTAPSGLGHWRVWGRRQSADQPGGSQAVAGAVGLAAQGREWARRAAGLEWGSGSPKSEGEEQTGPWAGYSWYRPHGWGLRLDLLLLRLGLKRGTHIPSPSPAGGTQQGQVEMAGARRLDGWWCQAWEDQADRYRADCVGVVCRTPSAPAGRAPGILEVGGGLGVGGEGAGGGR